MKKISLPLTDEIISTLCAGDEVVLSGTVFTARDVVHQRFAELIEKGKPLPVKLTGQVIFYAGPTPAPPGKAIGSIGPTTSRRMDKFTPLLLEKGIKGMIGKGDRSEAVQRAMAEFKAVYFVATGGAAAYLSQFIAKAEIVAFDDLGPEAVYRLELEGFPAVVGIDSKGDSIFDRVGNESGEVSREQ